MIKIGAKVKTRFGDIGIVIDIVTLNALDSDAVEGDLPYLICRTIDGREFDICEYEAEVINAAP